MVYTALQIEARAIASRLGLSRASRYEFIGNSDADWSISVRTIGLRAGKMPQTDDAALVILAGLAGALDPSLRCGDVVIDQKSQLTEAMKKLPFRIGRIYTSDRVITTPAEKSRLFNSTGALAVEMEAGIVRPAIHVRSISDVADESIDPAILRLIDEMGQPHIGKLLMTIIRRPMLVRDLKRLGSQSQVALDALARAVSMIVEALTESKPDL